MEQKATAKEKADMLMQTWLSGEATEETFAELANLNSADSDGTDGGLIENIYPNQMVASFNDWCFAEGRKAGDSDLIESSYGYHMMYYSGDSDITYRDYLITNELKTADFDAWYQDLLDSYSVEELSTKYVDLDRAINRS